MPISTKSCAISTKYLVFSNIYSVYLIAIAQAITHKEGEQMFQTTTITSEKIGEQANACFNHVVLTGKPVDITKDQNGTHFSLYVNRLSGTVDTIPVTVPFDAGINLINEIITVRGTFSSYNKIVDNRSKLILHVLAQEIAYATDEECQNPNVIELTAFICKAPIFRTTPFNREIADLLLAVNNLSARNESSYIPAIAWGKNARFAKTLLVGEKVQINGRIQSREYQKRFDDGTVEIRVAYEVSINTIFKEELQ